MQFSANFETKMYYWKKFVRSVISLSKTRFCDFSHRGYGNGFFWDWLVKLHDNSFQKPYSVSVGNFFEVRFQLIMLIMYTFIVDLIREFLATILEGPIRIILQNILNDLVPDFPSWKCKQKIWIEKINNNKLWNIYWM